MIGSIIYIKGIKYEITRIVKSEGVHSGNIFITNYGVEIGKKKEKIIYQEEIFKGEKR